MPENTGFAPVFFPLSLDFFVKRDILSKMFTGNRYQQRKDSNENTGNRQGNGIP